jgi:hypothetical protein
MPLAVRKSDDWLISGYLESRGIGRVLVPPHSNATITNNAPQRNPMASKKNALSSYGMHENAAMAAMYMQERLGIWSDYTFTNVSSFTDNRMDLLYCESGLTSRCPRGVSKVSSTKMLDNTLALEAVQYL